MPNLPDEPWREGVPEQNPRLYEHLGEPPENPPRVGTPQNPSWTVPASRTQFRQSISPEGLASEEEAKNAVGADAASRSNAMFIHNEELADPSKHILPGNMRPTVRRGPINASPQVGGSFLSVSNSPTIGAPRLQAAPPGTPEAAHAAQTQDNVTHAQGQHNSLMQRLNSGVERQGGDAALAKKLLRNYAYLRVLRGGAHGLLHGLAEGE